MKLIILVLLFLNFSKATASDLSEVGRCFHDPNAKNLQASWKKYFDLKKRKAKINSSLIVKEMRMDSETMKLIQAISESEKLITLFDKLQTNYLKKAFVDTRFNEMIASPDFISKLENKTLDLEIKNSKLEFKDDIKFYALIEEIRSEVTRKEIKDALELFRTYDLGILQAEYRKSAKESLKLIRKKGATLEEVRHWIVDPPFLRNVPLPHIKLGPFVIVYRNLVMKSVANFVLDRNVNLLEAKKFFPKIKKDEVEEMNSILPPVDNSAYDEQIYLNRDKTMAAIDGVARTLWGEAASCESLGLNQFLGIGKIITDRSLAVCRAIKEQESVKEVAKEVREKNWATILSNWVGIKRPAPGLQNRPSFKLKGLSDFGRKEKIDMPCASQVVSKKNQFSVWNSYSIVKLHTGQFHQNIPDSIYEIQGPQSENDDKALVRILCPEFNTPEQKKLWDYAVSIAKEIVLNPETLSKQLAWTKNYEILFYTHDANLPFAKEVKLSEILYDTKVMNLKKKGLKNVCNHFRLFEPKLKGTY